MLFVSILILSVTFLLIVLPLFNIDPLKRIGEFLKFANPYVPRLPLMPPALPMPNEDDPDFLAHVERRMRAQQQAEWDEPD